MFDNKANIDTAATTACKALRISYASSVWERPQTSLCRHSGVRGSGRTQSTLCRSGAARQKAVEDDRLDNNILKGCFSDVRARYLHLIVHTAPWASTKGRCWGPDVAKDLMSMSGHTLAKAHRCAFRTCPGARGIYQGISLSAAMFY